MIDKLHTKVCVKTEVNYDNFIRQAFKVFNYGQ